MASQSGRVRTWAPLGERPAAQRRQSNGSSVLLPRCTIPGSPVRIGTISWEGEEPWVQSPHEFLASVAASADGRDNCDLIVAAGLTASELLSPEDVLSASPGTRSRR